MEGIASNSLSPFIVFGITAVNCCATKVAITIAKQKKY